MLTTPSSISSPVTRSWLDRLARSRGWLSTTILTPAIIAVLFSPPHESLGSFLEFGFDALGWFLFFGGAVWRWWATLFIGGRKSIELITIGPYSLCRNPLYFGTFLMTLSIGVFLQSFTLLVAVAVVACAYLTVTVAAEERHLTGLHGALFTDYCRRVPRFFPRWAHYTSPPEVTLHLHGMNQEMWRMSRWAWIPVLCHLAAHLRCLEWWPRVFALP